MQYSHLDLFSGIGGFALAVRCINELLGYEAINTKQFVEIDANCKTVLNRNFPSISVYADIQDYLIDDKIGNGLYYGAKHFDIVTGGFPCQNLSVSNQQDASGLKGAKSGLWYEYLRLIKLLNPSIVIIENVPANKNKPWLISVLQDLNAQGYNALWRTFRAYDFGLPHRRKRLFIVAFKHNLVDGAIPAKFFGKVYKPSGIDLNILGGSSHREILKRIEEYQGIKVSICNKPSKENKISVRSLGNALIPAIAQHCFKSALNILDGCKQSGSDIRYKFQLPPNNANFSYLRHGIMLNGAIHPRTVLEPSDTVCNGLLRTCTASDDHRLRIGIDTLRLESAIGNGGTRNNQLSLVHNVATTLNRYPSVELYEYMMGFPIGWTKV